MQTITKYKDKPVNTKIFYSIIREFIRALGKAHTYNIFKNGYLIFGVLWGIPIPVVTLGIALYYQGIAFSLQNVLAEIVANPLHIFFLAHPILFGIVFGAMGTVRHEKEEERLSFENEIIEINEKLKKTNKKLQELDELKDNFLSMVSHELWSPLTTVEGDVSFLLEEKTGPLTDKQKDILRITEEGVAHLDYLIGELVDISRIEAGKFEVKPECIDILCVENKVINSLRQRAEEKRITLKNELPSELIYALADEKRITQVFNNILGNAIKFTPEGGVVSVLASINNDKIEFVIRLIPRTGENTEAADWGWRYQRA